MLGLLIIFLPASLISHEARHLVACQRPTQPIFKKILHSTPSDPYKFGIILDASQAKSLTTTEGCGPNIHARLLRFLLISSSQKETDVRKPIDFSQDTTDTEHSGIHPKLTLKCIGDNLILTEFYKDFLRLEIIFGAWKLDNRLLIVS